MKRIMVRLGLRKHVKVKVYLRSGQVIKFKCREWETKGLAPYTGENGLASYSFKGIKGQTIWFNITEVVAIEGEL